MASTIKVWAFCSFNEEGDHNIGLNITTNADTYSLFCVCLGSCCTSLWTVQDESGCHELGDAVLKLVMAGVMGVGNQRIIAMDNAGRFKGYLEKPASLRKFATLMKDLADALNMGVEFDRTVTLYR